VSGPRVDHGLQTLIGELLGAEHKPLVHRGRGSKSGVAVEHKLLDRLDAKVPRYFSWNPWPRRSTLASCCWHCIGHAHVPPRHQWRSGESRSEHLDQERTNPSVDVVDDGADLVDRLARRVDELPVEITLARIDRAGVTAAHGHDDVRSRPVHRSGFGTPSRRRAALLQDRGDRWIQLVTRSDPADSTRTRPSA